jgi:hypothetical protein
VIAGNRLVRLSLASLGGLLVLVCGLVLYDRMAGTPNRPTIDLTSNDLLPMSPQGRTTAEGVEVLSLGPGDQAMLLAAMRGIPADRYARIRWDIRGLSPDQDVALVWTSSTEPEQNQSLSPTPAERKSARLDLSQESGWAGRILALGISIGGPSNQPIVVKRLTLLPQPPTWRETLEGQLRNWQRLGPWRHNSINLHQGAAATLLTPVATVAIWIALTAIIYLLISRRSAAPATVKAFAALVLIGWLVLDAHWQWELVGRLSSTYARYGALEPSERPGVAPDKEVSDAARSIREHLAPAPARVFLVSADPQGYSTARLGYHLLPHRVYRGLTKIPSPKQAHPGDYVFLSLPTREVRYDRDLKVLSDRKHALRADLIVILPGFGGLFQVKGEATS